MHKYIDALLILPTTKVFKFIHLAAESVTIVLMETDFFATCIECSI
jgi:hypothetical protein